MTRVLCRQRKREAAPPATKIGDLSTSDHELLNEEGESRRNYRYAVVVQDLATQWIQSCPCKTITSQPTERIDESSSSRRRSQKLVILAIRWNLANPVKIYHGITELRHLIDPRRTVLLKELYGK